ERLIARRDGISVRVVRRCGLGTCAGCVPLFFFFQAEAGIRDWSVTGVQTCALPIFNALLEMALPIARQQRSVTGEGRADSDADSFHLSAIGISRAGEAWQARTSGAPQLGARSSTPSAKQLKRDGGGKTIRATTKNGF